MRSVGSHSTSGREKEGIKERMGWELIFFDREGEEEKKVRKRCIRKEHTMELKLVVIYTNKL